MQNITNSNWKVLSEFPDYAITPDGQVWSYKRNRFLKPCLDKQGYLKVNPSNDHGRSNHFVHRLVGMAFIPLPLEFNGNYSAATINHKDHNKQNNHYTNLEWVTLSHNSQEPWDNGYMDHMKKSCFCISIEDKKCTPFDSARDIDKSLNLPINTAANAINTNNGLIRGRYIAGYLDDRRWKEAFAANCTVEQIVESYADQIENYKPRNRGSRKITNLQTGESKEYKSLSEFAREKSIPPTSISSYLKSHSDLYSVELV